jgi:hypothetical protein
MTGQQKQTAIQKRAHNTEALAPFALVNLWPGLPLRVPLDPAYPPSPKPNYRSDYRYLDAEGLDDPQRLETLSSFDVALRLFDYANLEPFLAAHIYVPSAKGQVPFHPVSMYLLHLYRREHDLSRTETLRILKSEEGDALRQRLGFKEAFPSESGFRYFEGQITPQLQWEINALQIDMLYQAGFLPTRPDEAQEVTLSFDGMLHEARSRMRCAHVRQGCYHKAPRACPAQEKKKRGCDCSTAQCLLACRHSTPLDPEARLVVYTGNNKRPTDSPNAPTQEKDKKSPRSRFVYGYYSYAGQILDDQLATYWTLPAAFGTATTSDRDLFPTNFSVLQCRFPWLQVSAVLADAGAGYPCCLDPIWKAGALRMVDIRADKGDEDPEKRLARGYNDKGYPLCPFGYACHSNGHDYDRRLTKWRCAKSCRKDSAHAVPDCDYLNAHYKHGYTTTVGRTHADGSVRLAREIPYGSPAWEKLYNRRNCAESRNSILQRLGLKRLPVHGEPRGYSEVLLGDFVANQHTLVRLIREASALLPAQTP